MTNWIQLDPTSPVPLYQQMVDQIRRLVALGVLKAGDRLPTVRELASRARVNRNTAARAIQHLEALGMVRARVGQGTFVADDAAQVGQLEAEKIVDDSIDRLLLDASAAGYPLERLAGRLEEGVHRFTAPDPQSGEES